jgi:hypothetical protein
VLAFGIKLVNFFWLNTKVRKHLSEYLLALLVGVFTVLVSMWTFRESIHSIFANQIPLGGDGLLTGTYMKIAINAPIWDVVTQNLQSSFLGWPHQINFSSYPMGNTFEIFLIDIFANISGIQNPAQIIHIFSILKAGPISIAAYVLARIVGVRRLASATIGIAYALSTFNLVRAEGHFFLALTWSIPLGLAAIYLAYKPIYMNLPVKFSDYAKSCTLAFLSCLSAYYYSFFLIILATLVVLFLILTILSSSKKNRTQIKIGSIIHRVALPIMVLAIFVVGLLVQIIPIKFRSGKMNSLTGLADRSPIESIIYAGTPESLLFDAYSLILKAINRADLAAFFQSRISWEGSQIGALSGLTLLLLLLYFLFTNFSKLVNQDSRLKINKTVLEVNELFIWLLLSAALSLYFVSPLNFGISRVIPQIRAWGRLSVIITIMTLLLLGFLATKSNWPKALKKVLILVMVTFTMLETLNFHAVRPPSSSLNAVAVSKNFQLTQSSKELETIFAQNCSLVNLPIYPFPEFDRPDDANIDYGQLDLPLVNFGHFRWSYAGVKATENFGTWQPLISEFPPFDRAPLDYQVIYANALTACGAVIDTSYLSPSETKDLPNLIANYGSCATYLPGVKSNEVSRFIAIDFVSIGCEFESDPAVIKYATSNSSNSLLWRIDQSSNLGFEDAWQIFPIESKISVRLRVNESSRNESYLLKVKLQKIEKTGSDQIAICLTMEESRPPICTYGNLDANGIGSIPLPSGLLTGKLEKFSVAIQNQNVTKYSNWGIILEKEN